MTRKSHDERREEILRAAARVVIDRGFGRVGVRDLAAALEVSPGLLHHYFPSMDVVLAEAFRLYAREDEEALARALSGREDPLARLDAVLRYAVPPSGDRSCLAWIDATAEATRNEALRAALAGLNAHWHETLRTIVADGVEGGAFTSDDPSGSARSLLAAIDGLMTQLLVHHAIDRPAMLALARRTAERELGLPDGALAAGPTAGRRRARRIATVARAQHAA